MTEGRHSHGFDLVGIGASAGGITALKEFFRDVPEETGIAFVVVMHLSPEHESALAEVIQPAARIPVSQVQGRVAIEPDHVYVIPPNRNLAVADGHLDLSEFDERRGRRAPIDTFFRTIADVHPDGIGILLSGSGSDGVAGLKAIKEMGGVILVQSPREAEYEAMPRAAIATGLVDFVLPARELGAKVVDLKRRGVPWSPPPSVDDLEDEDGRSLREILSHLHTRTGHDFEGYKKSTVMRRIARRMQVRETPTLEEYLGYLRDSPDEPSALLKDLLISVTDFFRDPEAFDALQRDVVPQLFENLGEGDAVRVWVPGCATGEEAYSIAILLDEYAGTMESRPGIQIFASDLDEEAIGYARRGLYPAAVAADVGPERLSRYFQVESPYYRVRKELREMVLFAPHSVLKDPPFSRMDLVSCRNLLIYLEPRLQERLFAVLGYALHDGGHLFLGSSESIEPGRDPFESVDKRHRIFRRKPGGRDRRVYLPDLPLSGRLRPTMSTVAADPTPPSTPARGVEQHAAAVEDHAPPSVLVAADHEIVHVSPGAKRYLEYPSGTPTDNVLMVVRRELRVPLRTALFRASEEKGPVLSEGSTLRLDGTSSQVLLHVSPAQTAADPGLYLVVFLETPAVEEAGDPGPADSATARQLERTEQELQSLRSRFRSVVEESESRQEELRASNEELHSVNEEYKSTLEELETSKEELQSINEELKTVNDELKEKVDALARANDDLNNLVGATDIPTLFLDADLRIKRFTPALDRLFNVRPVDEGRPLADLTHRLDYPGLEEDCRKVLSSGDPLEREVDGRENRHFLARMGPYRTGEDRIDGVVVTFTDVTRLRSVREAMERSVRRFGALVNATAQIVWTLDAEGGMVEDSRSWLRFTGQTGEDAAGWGWLEAIHPEDREGVRAEVTSALDAEREFHAELRLWHAADECFRVSDVRGVPVRGGDGNVGEWVAMSSDITSWRDAEEELRRAKGEAERANQVKSQFLSTLSHELRTPLNAVIGLTDLMRSGISGPVTPKQEDNLDRIRRSAWHQLSMIEEILAFSRSEAGKEEVRLDRIDVAEIVRHVKEMLEPEAEKSGIVLRTGGADDEVTVWTDSGKVRQIVTNLVGNAVKFTREGSVEVLLEESDGEVVLHVRDTGPGIDPGSLEKIFEPFEQADASMTRAEGGTGLGLAVCRRFAALLGAAIEVESEPGIGSTFTLRIPRDVPAEGSSAP